MEIARARNDRGEAVTFEQLIKALVNKAAAITPLSSDTLEKAH
jgi:hypothetical protein